VYVWFGGKNDDLETLNFCVYFSLCLPQHKEGCRFVNVVSVQISFSLSLSLSFT